MWTLSPKLLFGVLLSYSFPDLVGASLGIKQWPWRKPWTAWFSELFKVNSTRTNFRRHSLFTTLLEYKSVVNNIAVQHTRTPSGAHSEEPEPEHGEGGPGPATAWSLSTQLCLNPALPWNLATRHSLFSFSLGPFGLGILSLANDKLYQYIISYYMLYNAYIYNIISIYIYINYIKVYGVFNLLLNG